MHLQHPFQLPNHFEILHRARQYHCRALWQISKWLSNWVISYGQTRFHKIWIQDEFRSDILCFNSDRLLLSRCSLPFTIYRSILKGAVTGAMIGWWTLPLPPYRGPPHPSWISGGGQRCWDSGRTVGWGYRWGVTAERNISANNYVFAWWVFAVRAKQGSTDTRQWKQLVRLVDLDFSSKFYARWLRNAKIWKLRI